MYMYIHYVIIVYTYIYIYIYMYILTEAAGSHGRDPEAGARCGLPVIAIKLIISVVSISCMCSTYYDYYQ